MPHEEELLINNNIHSNIEANTINNSWSSLIWSDTKKIIGTAGLLTAAVGLKTVQRVFQVAVTSIGSFDWNKVNPLNNLVDFGVTPVQLVISTQAMNLWKWGAEKIWQEGRTIFNRTADQEMSPLLSLYPEIGVEEGYSCLSKTAIFGKMLIAKVGYWISNHFMITASSMYSVGSLTSLAEYWSKIIYGPNILSTIIRAEVLCYTSILIDKGIEYLTKTHMWFAFKRYFNCLNNNINENDELESLFSQQSKCMSLLKSGGYLTAMVIATIIDNAIKTAAVMYTADRLPEFESTFFQVPMFAIMFGLIINDTIGNKVLNKYAKKQWQKFFESTPNNELEEIVTNSNYMSINSSDERQLTNNFNDELVSVINSINGPAFSGCPRTPSIA
ncbi:hypothetical protein [Spiroplasma endosymbiont of Melieria omissa]|uniref:hypothetical protein n=1 Tax=Spiroplasma endosymbiont of Melieria omissa TaxID=3139324 RepID=UPI003CCB6F5C